MWNDDNRKKKTRAKFFLIGVSAVWSGEPGYGLSSYCVSLWDGLQWLHRSGMEAFCSLLARQTTEGAYSLCSSHSPPWRFSYTKKRCYILGRGCLMCYMLCFYIFFHLFPPSLIETVQGFYSKFIKGTHESSILLLPLFIQLPFLHVLLLISTLLHLSTGWGEPSQSFVWEICGEHAEL